MILRIGVCILTMVMITHAAEKVAFIKNMKGEASIKRESGIIVVNTGDPLFAHDVITTGDKSTLGISFNDGSRVSVGPKSVFTIDDYMFVPSNKEFRFDVTLHKGTSVFESGRIGKLAPEKVNFRVPQGVVGIRGTKFVVEVE